MNKSIAYSKPTGSQVKSPGAISSPPSEKRLLPCNWLTAREIGERFGKSQFAVYRWINEGLIPEHCLQYRGRRQVLISIDALVHLRAVFREMHQ